MKMLSWTLVFALLFSCPLACAEEAIENEIGFYDSLLDEHNAFNEYIAAQSNVGYHEEILKSMVLTLADAFNTAKLGTGSVQAAVHGLIPESIYKDGETPSDKMALILDYFCEGNISRYFSLEFDNDDNPVYVDITLENIEQFIEDAIQYGVFVGSIENFDPAPSIKSLTQVCEKMNITQEVGLTFLEIIVDYDIWWLDEGTNFISALLGE